MKKSGLAEGLVPQRLALFQYRGKTYGVPQSLSAMVLYYRTDLFEKYDLRPSDLATWDAFFRVGQELMAQRQALTALDPTYFEVLLRQRGSDLFGKDGKAFPDRGAAREVLNYLYDLQREGIAVIPDRSSVFDPVFFSSSVSSGDILCLIGADWYGLDMIQQFTPELKGKWGVMPLPAWKKPDGKLGPRTSTFAGQGLMIYRGSKRTEAAWDFIEFVMKDTEANVRRFTRGNSFPAYRPAWKDPRLLEPVPYFNDQRFGKLLVELAPEVPPVAMHPKRPQAVFLFQENFFSSFIYGQLSADETLDRMKEILDKP